MKSLLFLLIPVTVIASEIALDNEQGIKERVSELSSLELKELLRSSKVGHMVTLKKHPDRLQAKCGLALCHNLLGEWYQAERLWEEVLAKDTNNFEAHKGLQTTCYNIAIHIHGDSRLYDRGWKYALKALQSSEHFTLPDEMVAELVERYGGQEDSGS